MHRVGALLSCLLASCAGSPNFTCETDDACRRGSTTGYCEHSGYCSFTDQACEARRRYDASAGDELAGQCVDDIVAGRLALTYATNDASFAPLIVDTAYDPSAIGLVAKLSDGTATPVTYRANGEFSFPAPPGDLWRLEISRNGGITEHQRRARYYENTALLAGRPDRALVTQPTTIEFQYVSNPSGSTMVVTTGLWTTSRPGNAAAFTFEWNTAGSLHGRLGLLDASKHDRIYVVKAGTSNGVMTIRNVATAQVTLVDGGIAMVPPGTLAPVTADRCKRLAIGFENASNRISAVRPGTYLTIASWSILAVPSFARLGTTGGLDVAAWSDSSPSDQDTMVSFHNPYVGTELIARASVSAGFPLLAPGASVPAFASHDFAAVAAFSGGSSCAADGASLASTVAIAGIPEIANTALDTENKPIAIDRSRPVHVTWALAAPGPATSYIVDLYELTVSQDTTAVAHRRAYNIAEPPLLIDPDLLVAGRPYALRVRTNGNNELSSMWSRSFVPM